MAYGRNRRRSAWCLLAFSLIVGVILLSSRWVSAKTTIGSCCFIELRSGRIHFWRPFQQFGPSWAAADVGRRAQPELLWTPPPALGDPFERVLDIWIFSLDRIQTLGQPTRWSGCLMLWPTALIALTASASLLLWGHQPFRRARRGLCGQCAYNLEATPSGAPCPECGTFRNGMKAAVK